MNNVKMSECIECNCIPELVDGRVKFFARCNCPAGDNVVYGQSVSFLDHISIDDDDGLSDKVSSIAFDLVPWGELKQSAIDAWESKQLIAKQQAEINSLNKMVSQRGIDNTMLRVKAKWQQVDIELLRDELKKFLPMAFDEDGEEDYANSHGDFQYNDGCEGMGDSVISVLAATAKG